MKKIQGIQYLTDRGLASLITGLIKDFKVYGTVSKDGFPAFAQIGDAGELVLFQTPTHLSAKEFFFPQKETLLRFDMRDGTHEPVVEAEEQAVVGLHPCDIHAVTLMDRVFASGTPDVNYLARRERTVIIGTDCLPDEYCFCSSVGTMEVEEGFDLFLHRLAAGVLVRVGSKKGARLLARHTKARDATAAQLKERQQRDRAREASFTTRLDAPAHELPEIYSKSDDSPIWDRIGAICYGCGSCNNVCPTCYCFDVRDEVLPDLTGGERVRVWDACTLEDFARVAGGHNFRTTRAARLRHRFNRKFRYLSDRFDHLFCVGCGRCSRTCLVRINIAEVTNGLIRERNKG
ncbi:MAG: 4Fe-4S dicluster domain-containing protein [Thermodesulfobacteriota bacterium]